MKILNRISKIFIVVIVSIIGIIIYILLPNNNHRNIIFFSENTGLYFFSAFLQANAAILSVVGVFMIFKIQSLQNVIDIIQGSFINKLENKWSFPDWVMEFANMKLEDKKSKYKEFKYDKYTMSCLSEWINKEDRVSLIKKSIRLPTILLAVGIVVTAVGLILANYIHECGFNLELRILYLTLLFEILILYHVVKGILKAIAR